MDIGQKIIKETEENCIKTEKNIFDKVLNEFLIKSKSNLNINNLKNLKCIVYGMKNELINSPKSTKLLFDILEKYNYNMKSEITEAMFYLSSLENPNKNKDTIKTILNSPIIQDVSFNGTNKFTISNEQYGDFIFELASYYYRNNSTIKEYIKNTELPSRCHKHTMFMSRIFLDHYSITSICPNCFTGKFHHSYTYNDKNDIIIDLCYNSIVNKDLYYNIFEPNEVSRILNRNVPKEVELTNLKTSQYFDRYALLKVAIYKEHLKNIGFNGDLEHAPYIK